MEDTEWTEEGDVPFYKDHLIRQRMRARKEEFTIANLGAFLNWRAQEEIERGRRRRRSNNRLHGDEPTELICDIDIVDLGRGKFCQGHDKSATIPNFDSV